VSLAGLRCLGIAYREVANVLEWLKCDRLKFETDLTLLGLVTFDNKLKEDTAITISNLMKA
jgi:magnesium-transporting ATPase (P-type)